MDDFREKYWPFEIIVVWKAKHFLKQALFNEISGKITF